MIDIKTLAKCLACIQCKVTLPSFLPFTNSYCHVPGAVPKTNRKQSQRAPSSPSSKSRCNRCHKHEPKLTKQRWQQQPSLPEQEGRDWTWEGWSRIAPPGLLANGKPDDPKSALHRGPPESRGPLLSLPPPPLGKGPIQGGQGPRCGPNASGW